MTRSLDRIKRKAVWGAKAIVGTTLVALLGSASLAAAAGPHNRTAPHAKPGVPGQFVKAYKLDGELTLRAKGNPLSTSSVIVTLVPGAQLPPEFKKFARTLNLGIINGQVLDLPNGMLKKLEAHPNIFRIHDNRKAGAHNYRTSVTVGAASVGALLGFNGNGIGIAVIDSGIASWHDDFTNKTSKVYPYGNQRVAKFVDFVNGRTLPYDDNGHGTHVSGIIAGNGYDSLGLKAGIAPGASIISLKVLDANGQGTIGNIIAALNWVAVNAQTYNIRVVNMSVGAAVHESYWTDPLTLAVKKVTDKGITVVTAAGNLGKDIHGVKQYGGITAPANAPWVLTVGASSTMGTLTRLDDTMAGFSSRGPTYKDFLAKPDLVAPGVGTVSLSAPGSNFFLTKTPYLLGGILGPAKPYLTLSGTSMASPVVAGTVALMLQANPTLTPNLIKAILQYTAQQYPGYKPLEQGAGFLNSLGAVRLARFYYTRHVGDRMPVQTVWSRQLIWGNHKIKGGYINPRANAWANNVIWGSAKTLGTNGDNIIWGTECDGGCDNIIWGTNDESDNIIWGTDDGDNIIWGTDADGDNIIWGTSDNDNIVWGTDCGGADCDNIIWGTSDDDNIVWGTADIADNIIWGTSDGDNIIWGTSASDDVTWGTASGDAEVFNDDDAFEPVPDPALEFGDLTVDPTVVTE